MSSTLFVREIPSNITEPEFGEIWQGVEGYLTCRLRADRQSNVVGFVEFRDTFSAGEAMKKLQGFKKDGSDADSQGFDIQFSRNSKRSRGAIEAEQAQLQAQGSSSSSGGNAPSSAVPPASGGNAPAARPRRRDNQQQGGGGGASNGNGDASAANYHNAPSSYPDASGNPSASASNSNNNNNNNNVPAQHSSLVHNQQSMDLTDSSATLYIEGVPLDATEREVAHIFRPFPGFRSVRLIHRDSRRFTNTKYFICFCEFDSKYQAAYARSIVQGYRFDKTDSGRGLNIQFAKTDRTLKKEDD